MYRASRPYAPNQVHKLPRDPRKWMEENDFVYFVQDFLNMLNLDAFREKVDPRKSRAGAPTYDHRMLLGVLLYCYANGIFSSRKMAEAVKTHLPLIYLSGEQQPSYSTIARFRAQHVDKFKDLLAMMVNFALEEGYIGFDSLGVDGTKIAASASMGKNIEVACEIKKKTKEAVDKAEQIDREEEGKPIKKSPEKREIESNSHESNKEKISRKERLEKVKQSHKEASQKSSQDEKKDDEKDCSEANKSQSKKEVTKKNLTDSDSRIMKTSKGFLQGYNAQLAIEGKNQFIVGAYATSQQNDQHELLPVLNNFIDTYKIEPNKLLADAGYCNEETLEFLEKNYECEGIIATGRGGVAKRKINTEKLPYTSKMSAKLASDMGKKIYSKRQWICEAPISWLKEVLGFTRFRLRGLIKVSGELSLAVLALNLLRLHRMIKSAI